jgi:hypothetical protein
MSVHVTNTDNPNGAWTIAHDEGMHEGTADPSTLGYGQNMDGSENRDMVVIPCPVAGCGSVSYWPREALPPAAQEALPA